MSWSLMDQIKAKAKADKKRILLPEGTEERTVQAAAKIVAEGLGRCDAAGKAGSDCRGGSAVFRRFGGRYAARTRRHPPDLPRYIEEFL